MGVSGLLAGGVLLSVVGLLAGIMSVALNMWLIQRIELHNKLCWTGEGLWLYDYVWGVDIPEMGLTCSGEAKSVADHFCHVDAHAQDADLDAYPASYRDAMCSRTTMAKVSSLASVVAGAVTLCLTWLVFVGSTTLANFARRVTATPPVRLIMGGGGSASIADDDTLSEASDEGRNVEFDSEFKLAVAATVAACAACALQAATFFNVYTSPMFSNEHAHDISQHNAVPFNSSQFGCVFQSPLARVTDITKSSPLRCLFGGPSFAMSAMSFVSWAFAVFFFAMLAYHVKRLQRFQMSGNPAIASAGARTVRHPMLSALLFPRTYSLHGAVSRRFQHLPPWRRRILVMGLPFLSLGTAVLFAVMMLNNGSAVQVFVRIQSPLLSDPEVMNSVAQRFHLAHKAHVVIQDDVTRQPHTIEIIEEVFDFTMLTSITNFWDGKAYALAILTAVFCAVWPFLRVFIQILLYFVPVDEAERGRTLTWLDALGKWPLVNLFILCFMGVAFHLNALIKVPGLVPRRPDLVDVGVEVILAPRFATYVFVVGCALSILVSTLNVYIHRWAKHWEEASRTPRSVSVADTPYTELRRPMVPAPRTVRYLKGYGYEALCDRFHMPVPGKKYVYTPLAKTLVWMLIGFTACTTLAGMLEVSLAFTFMGVIGNGLVDEHDRYRAYSMLSIGVSIETDMGGKPMGTQFLTAMFFITALIGPLLRICGLTLMWFVPMRPQQQQGWFHIMEIIDGWSALDVFFVSTLAATLEIGDLSHSILGSSFPNLEKLADDVLPSSGGLFVVKESLLNGMWLLLTAVLCEKLLSQFIVSQTAITVAERLAEEAAGPREEQAAVEREIESHPEILVALSPAARYTSASGMQSIVYSGLPRFVWSAGIAIGLMVPADEDDANEAEQQQGQYFVLG